MDRIGWSLIAALGASCVGGTAPAVAPRGAAPRCEVAGPAAGQAPWQRWSASCADADGPTGSRARLDGDGALEVRGSDGAVRWRRALGGCGGRVGVAVGYDGAVVAACGRGLRGFAADGAPRWTVELGTAPAGPPLIDRAGVTYATAGAVVVAIDRDGRARWRTGFEPDRALSALGVTAAGALVVDSTVEPFAAGDVVFHPDPDPRLYRLERDGGVARELPRDRGWPVTVATPDGRVP